MIYKGHNAYTGMRLNDKFTGGKYKGEYLLQVIQRDKAYLMWATKNASLKLDSEAKAKLDGTAWQPKPVKANPEVARKLTIPERRKIYLVTNGLW